MSVYEGRAFHESLDGGQAGGRLSIGQGGVRWDGAETFIDLPLGGLELELGGASDRVVFFKHPYRPGWVLTTTDPRALGDAALATHPTVAAQVTRARRRRLVAQSIVVVAAGLVVAVVVALVLLKDPIVRHIARAVPPDAEIALGEAAAGSFAASLQVIEDGDAAARLAELTGPVLAGVGPTRYPYEFTLVADPTVNAFALPGGKVFVHSGLVLRAESPEEVAGVLAHEIAHVEERHAVRSMIQDIGLSILAQAVIGDATGIQAAILQGAPSLVGLAFSRDFEREADERGFDYLVRAGLDPRGMSSMFRKLHEDEQGALGSAAAVSGAFALLSTHPASEERFERLEALEAALPPDRSVTPLPIDFAAFQETIRGLSGSSSGETSP